MDGTARNSLPSVEETFDRDDEIVYEPLSTDELSGMDDRRFGGGGYVFGGSSGSRDQSSEDSWEALRHARDLSPHELGDVGEDEAARYLTSQGYEIVERNWVCPWGEADIICLDEGAPVLVEVKTRLETSDDEPLPELAVTAKKRERYRGIAECFMEAYGVDDVRFDVVAISVRPGRSVGVRHYKSAFTGDE